MGSFIAVEKGEEGRIACYSDEGHLKIWEVSSGRLEQACISHNHIAAQYTSISWAPSLTAKKKYSGLVALGTAHGSILLWDINLGKLLHTFSITGLSP